MVTVAGASPAAGSRCTAAVAYFVGRGAHGRALLVYEHSLVRRRGLAAIDKAFFDVNAWVSVAFFALVLTDELLGRG